MNEAAKQLFITQPSLSNAVKDLEQEMGIHIFHRTSKGITLTKDGMEFLTYARQVIEHADILENRYKQESSHQELFAVSSQHYSFVVEAFSALIQSIDAAEYEFILRETKTHDILEDVRTFRSEIGILYLNHYNRDVMTKRIQDAHLTTHHLAPVFPHILLHQNHPLAHQNAISLEELRSFPYLSFEQGTYHSFYYKEEIYLQEHHTHSIVVTDRATLHRLMADVEGYTFGTGALDPQLDHPDTVAIPLEDAEEMELIYVHHRKNNLSHLGLRFLDELHKCLPRNTKKA